MPKRPQKKPVVKTQTPEERKALIVTRMQALEELENKLGCIFMPVTHHNQVGGYITGTSNYIIPLDAPKEPTKEEEPVV